MQPDLLTTARRILFLDSPEEYLEIIKSLTDTLLRDPDQGFALNNRGLAFFGLGRADEALEDLRKAAAILTQSGVPSVIIGDLLLRLGRIEEALVHYGDAIQREPDRAPFRRSRAHALHKLGRMNDAIVDYDAAIRLDPKFKKTRDLRALAAAGKPWPDDLFPRGQKTS
jgi:tetratricopeptide (TPR) repeat protein